MSDTQRKTRSTNKDKHPGLLDVDEETLARPIPRPKRTRVQILADAAAAQRKKDEKLKEEQREVARKAAGIEEIARLESKMKADEDKSALNAAHLSRFGLIFPSYLPIFPFVIYLSPPPSSINSPYVINPFLFVLSPCTLLITRTCILG